MERTCRVDAARDLDWALFPTRISTNYIALRSYTVGRVNDRILREYTGSP